MVKNCIYTARHCIHVFEDNMFLKKWHRKAYTSDPPTLLAIYIVHTMYIPNCHSMRNSIVYTEYMAVQTSTKLYYSGITFITPWDFKIHSMSPDEPCTYNQNSLLPKLPVYYRVWQFISELEIRTLHVLKRTELVLFRSYNQGTYGRGASVARRPLTVWLVPCSNNSVPIWTALFSVSQRRWPRTCPHLGPGRKEDCNSWDRLGLAVGI